MPKKKKKGATEDVWAQDKEAIGGKAPGGDHPSSQYGQRRQLPKGNPLFDVYYKRQGIVDSEEEWTDFMASSLLPLPVTFRVTSGRFADGIRQKLGAEDHFQLEGLQAPDLETEDGVFTVHAPSPISWVPDGYAWSINAPRAVIRKCPQLKAFHQWLVMENGQGNVNRQEAVSMIPPLLLDVRPGMTVLDLCAAPGSKTAQLIDFVQGDQPHVHDQGLVVANDSDTSRCYMLVHQLKRFAADSIVVTNHLAQFFPLLRKGTGSEKTEGVQFDRVLCDVPCSGDGTMRKSPDVWMKWKPSIGMSLHALQVSILIRGIELTAVGGRIVYSTCSLNPHENEAVVAEAVRRFGGKVVVEDVSDMLPALKRKPGLLTWGVRDPDPKQEVWYDGPSDVPTQQRTKIPSTVWPPSSPEEAVALGLPKALRLLPHLQDTGGFFVCVLKKREALVKGHDYNLGSEAEPEKQLRSSETHPGAAAQSGGSQQAKRQRAADWAAENPAAKAAGENLRGAAGVLAREATAAATAAAAAAAAAAADTGESKAAEGGDATPADPSTVEMIKGPRGREIDPRELQYEAVPLTAAVTDLGPHYGLPADFPFDCLVARGNDTERKRLALVSSAAKRLLDMDTGKQLKIVNAGCKVFHDTTRQGMKDENWGAASSNYRLTQESIDLMLPMISNRVVSVTLADMRQIMSDAMVLNTDANTYGSTSITAGSSALSDAAVEALGKITPGCAVLVLDDADAGVEQKHRLAVTCWKGWGKFTLFVEKAELLALIETLKD